jgi:hypothetical protein
MQTQRVNAIEALYLPLSMAILLSNDIVATFPSDFKLVHFYIVGRCGSTLLSKAMDTTEHCQSLSEPDIFTILSRYTMRQSKVSLTEHQNKLVSIIKAALILPSLTFASSKSPKKSSDIEVSIQLHSRRPANSASLSFG